MDPAAVATLLARGETSRWSNLGYWETARRYPEAARALAIRLAEAVDLRGAERVLDVGVGCGEQLLLWLQEFEVGHVVALEPRPAALAVARDRIAEAGLSKRVSFHLDPAAALAPTHGEGFDRALALDCAYQFPSRARDLARIAARLRPGGRLAATDLVEGKAPSRIFRALAPGFGIPRDNLCSPSAYREQVAQAGLVGLQLSCWTRAVLGGFAGFARREFLHWLRPSRAAAAIAATAAVAAIAAQTASVDYVLVCAERPPVEPEGTGTFRTAMDTVKAPG